MEKKWQSKSGPRDATLERYLSFKIRFIEAIHFATLRKQKLAEHNAAQVLGHDCVEHVAHTMQAALYTWIAGLSDPDSRAVDVFRLWKEFFPTAIKEITDAERKTKAGLKLIRQFRHKHGAHAALFEDLLASHQELSNNQQLIEETVGYFLEICEALVKQEREIFPNFVARLEEFINKHHLNESFRCIATSTPTLKEIIENVPPTPHSYQGQQIETIEIDGKKFALLRPRR